MPLVPHAPHAAPLAHTHAGTAAVHLRVHVCMRHACLTHTTYDRTLHIAHWHGPLFWHLLCVKESSAASHKCHDRVRHFGRVFISPYKTPSTPLAAQCDAQRAFFRWPAVAFSAWSFTGSSECARPVRSIQSLKVCLVHRALWLLELMICCNASV